MGLFYFKDIPSHITVNSVLELVYLRNIQQFKIWRITTVLHQTDTGNISYLLCYSRCRWRCSEVTLSFPAEIWIWDSNSFRMKCWFSERLSLCTVRRKAAHCISGLHCLQPFRYFSGWGKEHNIVGVRHSRFISQLGMWSSFGPWGNSIGFNPDHLEVI